MDNFFNLTYVSERKYSRYGVAYCPSNIDPLCLPRCGIPIDSWVSFEMIFRGNKFTDYLANELGARLCSEKLRDAIELHRYETDIIQWLEVVVSKGKDKRKYFIAHFPKDTPVLNTEKSLYSGKILIKPVLSYELVKTRSIFALPQSYGTTTYISQDMRNRLKQYCFTGLSFESTLVA